MSNNPLRDNPVLLQVSDEDSMERLRKYEIFRAEANLVRIKDKKAIRDLFRQFRPRDLLIGIGFQRAYGSILSGDYFDLFRLSDRNFLFVFADISGHGLPAYTTLIRLKSAIILAVKEMESIFYRTGILDYPYLVRSITIKFTDIMDMSNSSDFASVNFVFFEDNNGFIKLRFFNRSMLYPIVIRRNEQGNQVCNLNYPMDNWTPNKGYLIGSDIKSLLNIETYYNTPECCFDLNQGDQVLFYTDGITEAFDHLTGKNQYGDKRLEQKLLEMCDLPPQLIINNIFDSVYEFIGSHEYQKDDMTAVLIDLPLKGE